MHACRHGTLDASYVPRTVLSNGARVHASPDTHLYNPKNYKSWGSSYAYLGVPPAPPKPLAPYTEPLSDHTTAGALCAAAAISQGPPPEASYTSFCKAWR